MGKLQFALDAKTREVVIGTGRVCLSEREFAAFRKLAEKPGAVVSKEALSIAVWGDEDRAMQANRLINRIRRRFTYEGIPATVIGLERSRGWYLAA